MAINMSKKARKNRKKERKLVKKTKNVEQEIGFIGKALRGLGSLGGSTLGAMIGQPALGQSVGTSLGAAISKWLGTGDYTVSRNTLVQKAASGIPMMHKTGQTVTIRHREFITQINGTTEFTVGRSLILNPGLASTFPWLSRIAQGFQEYQFKGIVFHYIPTSGNAVSSTNSALGTVMMQTSYRSTDSVPVSKHELLNEYWSNEVVACDTMCHPIECDPKENPFAIHYVRSGSLPEADEPLMYDLGKTFICTSGMQSTNAVGDLWVTYEVDLKKPVVNSNVLFTDDFVNASYDTVPSLSNMYSGTLATRYGGLDVDVSGHTITIPAYATGWYNIRCLVYASTPIGAAATISWTGASTLTNCTLTTEPIPGYVDTVGTTITGTNPTTTTLSYNIGVSKTTVASAATIALPPLVFSSGTANYAAIFINRTHIGSS